MIGGRYSLVVALPKGRNFNDGYGALQQAGLRLPAFGAERALLHGQPGEVALLELRNHDVPTYVDLGIADLGIVGKDVLLESGRDVYEPVDLRTGVCRLSLIRLPGENGPLRRIATKYPNFTARVLRQRGIVADVVELAGNVELAAITGLTDAIVDLVSTGATLRANGLVEVEVWARSSTRLIVNRQSLKLKRERLRPLIARLRQQADAQAPGQTGGAVT
ncbi:ATP phosphoribosyltransferase [Meiothermus granaticius]|uniref:ATP phosphoribosyltransferase n=1 Tax=Meiothermus granaticius NBRC 107808 TaxID=1227551 RepID=A0A399FA41_9DEIN|nr:ATP phosphoribosyltransferase [Meiothermus granaticius]RIH91501.1 ATP phosphoribosyltransferase [Meiothermus granaticius NBRC 107808]GEM88035.1 ATP phosphoribosyltransferase [Meiothermus granaticius NBRC 107808]